MEIWVRPQGSRQTCTAVGLESGTDQPDQTRPHWGSVTPNPLPFRKGKDKTMQLCKTILVVGRHNPYRGNQSLPGADARPRGRR
jgi:hypothetical protein